MIGLHTDHGSGMSLRRSPVPRVLVAASICVVAVGGGWLSRAEPAGGPGAGHATRAERAPANTRSVSPPRIAAAAERPRARSDDRRMGAPSRRWLRSPSARDQRRRSRFAHRNLGGESALKLAVREAPEVAVDPVWNPPSLRPGEKIAGYMSPNTARITRVGVRGSALVEALGSPIATARPDGSLTKVDTTLVPADGGWRPRAAPVDIVVPTDLSRPVSIGAPGGADHVLVSPAERSAAGVLTGDRKVFYAEVARDTDALVEAVPDGASFSWIVRSPESPELLPLKVRAAGGGVARVRADGGASVEYGSTVKAMITAPVAVDAQGVAVRTRFRIVDGVLTVDVPHRDEDLAYPIAIDPVVNWYGTTALREEDPDGAWFAHSDLWRFGASTTGRYTPYTDYTSNGYLRFGIKTVAGTSVGAYAWWYYDPIRTSTIFRAEFGGVTHRSESTDLRVGLAVPGSWDETKFGAHFNPSTGEIYAAAPWVFTNSAGIASRIDVLACSVGDCSWGGSPNNIAGFGLNANAMSYEGADASFLGGYFYIRDYDLPVVHQITGIPDSSWARLGSLSSDILVQDPGVGLGSAWSGHGGTAMTVGVDGVDRFSDGPVCDGGGYQYCPEWFTTHWESGPMQGIRNLTFRSADIVGNRSTLHTRLVKLDNEGPQVSVGGRFGAILRELTTEDAPPRTLVRDAEFTVTAKDGDSRSPTDERSGVQVLQATIADTGLDGDPVPTTERALGPEVDTSASCPAPRDSCSATGRFTFPASTLEPGVYLVRIRAVDRAGNSTVKTYKVGVGVAELTSVSEGQATARYVPLQARRTRGSAAAVRFEWRPSAAAAWQEVPVSAARWEADGSAVTAWPIPLNGSGESDDVVVDLDGLRTVDAGGAAVPLADRSQVAFRALVDGGEPIHQRGSEDVFVRVDRGGRDTSDETTSLGPGEVDLVTGNFAMSESDVSVDAYVSDLTVTRSYNSRYTGEPSALGPGWTLGLPVEGAAATFSRVIDMADVGRPEGDRYPAVTVESTDGGQSTFELASTGDRYVPELGLESLRLERVARPGAETETQEFRLTDADTGLVMTFAERDSSATAEPGTFKLSAVSQPGAARDVTYTYAKMSDGKLRAVRMLAPTAGAVECESGFDATAAVAELQSKPSIDTRGCQALGLTYAKVPIASKFGNSEHRLTAVSLRTWDPDLGEMRTVEVARYSYDEEGRLVEAWDPRISPPLKDRYTYDAAGVLIRVTPPAEEPFEIAYASRPGETTPGRVRQISRSALDAGVATWSVRFGVPISGSGAPHDMSASSVATWGQGLPPFMATAVFPPDQIPDSDPPASWERASIAYLDPLGREVNSAQPGGRITTSELDKFGNEVRSLSAENRARALREADPTAASRRLDTRRTYSTDGRRMLEEIGPQHQVKLHDTGAAAQARRRTVVTYDEGAPAAPDPYDLPTTTRVSALVPATGEEHDVRTNRTEYDWPSRLSVASIVDPGPGGLGIERRVVLNAAGQEIERRQPRAPDTSDTPSTTKTSYYSAGGGSGDPDCDNRPEWLGLPCKEGPGAQPATPGLPALPVKTYFYDLNRRPTKIRESVAGGASRETLMWYDAAGRPGGEFVSGSHGTQRPVIAHGYDPASGRETQTISMDTSGTITQTITRSFDSLGRLTTYTDGSGHTSTSTYDLLSRLVETTDGIAAIRRVYDPITGDLSRMEDSVLGAVSGTYDADGRLIKSQLPGNIDKTVTYNDAGAATQLIYKNTSGCAGMCSYTDTVARNIHGQVMYNPSKLNTSMFATRAYRYDAAGRIVSATESRSPGQCTTRLYRYDKDSNRLAASSYPEDFDGCSTSTDGTTRELSYDDADRLTSDGYSYDAFGRTKSVPAIDAGGDSPLSASYYVDDLAREITQGSETSTLALDPLGRIDKKTELSGSASTTETYVYSDDSDEPAWVGSGLTWKRYFEGIDGDLVSTSNGDGSVKNHITNLRGDVVGDIGAGGVTDFTHVDEFGVPLAPLPTDRNYGFLGAKQREALTSEGTIAMGVRLYTPQTGRFLQTDPVSGGTANPYEYPSDPINSQDLDGKCTVKTYYPTIRYDRRSFEVWAKTSWNRCAEREISLWLQVRRPACGGQCLSNAWYPRFGNTAIMGKNDNMYGEMTSVPAYQVFCEGNRGAIYNFRSKVKIFNRRTKKTRWQTSRSFTATCR